VLLYANTVRVKNLRKNKGYYKYLLPALICKIVGGISLCLIYTFYYSYGGDVTNYFLTSVTFVNSLYSGDFELFGQILNVYDFDVRFSDFYYKDYGYIYFNGTDNYAMFTVLLTVPACILGLKSFIATTIVVSSISFIGLWKLYEVFIDHFPMLRGQFAVAIFFMPSVFFWGSGILKDTYALSCIGFFTYAVYRYLILKQRKVKYLIMLVISAMIIIAIKPYILFALMPGSLIWNYFNKIQNIKNALLRTLSIPLMLTVLLVIIVSLFSYLGNYLGEYSIDKVLQKAVKTQQDLVRSQYGSNSYNIGVFEPTLAGISSKIPAALNMALFRPYIWDARNPVMLLSGLENLFILCFSIYILLRVKITTLFRSLFSHPLLIFSFLFALFFAFSVGLTTANYGALVRLKIPCIPFYLSSLFILFHLNKKSFKRK
jgi:hypothetical protein